MTNSISMPGSKPVPEALYRSLAIATALCFCFAFVLVHVVRDDLSLWHTTLSIYAVGPAGWVLTLGFYAIAITQLLIAWRFYQLRQSTADLLIVNLLALAAIGAVLVATFPYTVKLPHNTGAVLQLGLFPVFLLLRVWFHRQDVLWTFSAVMAAFATIALLLLLWEGLDIFDLVSFGLVEKAEIIFIALWLLVYSWRLPGPLTRAPLTLP